MKIWRLLIKAALLFALINFVLVAVSPGKGFSASIYNHLVPGRARLPFGENAAEAYNLSLFDIDAMFAAHEISVPKASDEFRVVVVGDSSVWGTLLRPEETLAGQLNTLELETADGLAMRFYNVGYPTISLTKDLLIFEEAIQYEPDLIVWMLTLESFPADKQLDVPLVSHNPARVERLATAYDLNLDLSSDALIRPDFLDTTLIGRRRAFADWYRLQVYGLMWGITGVDQAYPESYKPAQIDFENDDTFHNWAPPILPVDQLALDALGAGQQLAGETPLIFINEPILISDGENSDIRYNFFYPRWAYNQYRELLLEKSAENDWTYYDLWDIVPMGEFTNSAVHLTVDGEAILVENVAEVIEYELNR